MMYTVITVVVEAVQVFELEDEFAQVPGVWAKVWINATVLA